jgi:hypothetical protein
MRSHREGTHDAEGAAESAVDIQDTPSDEPDHRAELTDGPAAGEFRAIHVDGTPPSELDVELPDGTHAGYVYFGRRGDLDGTAYAYGWDRQQPATTPLG